MIRSTLTVIAVTLILFTTHQADARTRHHTQAQEPQSIRYAEPSWSALGETRPFYDSAQRKKQILKHYTRQRQAHSKKSIGGGSFSTSFYQSSPSAPWLRVAQKYLGSGPSALGVRRSLWCAAGLNKFLQQAGYRTTGSDMASSFANYGSPTTPRIGAIAVMTRGGGGHVGIVISDLGNGKVKILSANHSGRVAYGTYPKSRIYAYRWPSGGETRYASLN